MADIVISENFTIDDIHKIRERNYERTKNMTPAEKIIYYNMPRTDAEAEIEKRRRLKCEASATA